MMLVRWCVAGLCFITALPVAAQTSPPRQPAPGESTIVVNGGIEAKKSNWKRAESDHVIVYSDGSDAELKRVTNNLERLYTLMSRLYRKGDTSDDTAKLQVTLFDSARFFEKMDLQGQRWQEGPYPPSFAGQRYYDPREDGEVLAVSRSDQVIKLATKKAFDKECDKVLGEGGNCNEILPPVPTARSWESVLYSAFAQHFLLTYTRAVYPRWYVDGVGALFSTMEVHGDGSIDYARAPDDYRQVFNAYGDLDVKAVLSGAYLEPSTTKTRVMDWTPYHAWLLAHFFTYSKLNPARALQFKAYMTAIHQGVPMAQAAKIFGDMRRLQSELNIYASNSTSYARTAKHQPFGSDPLIATLSLGGAALIEAKIQLGSQGNADWIAGLRDKVAKIPHDADALLLLAEAECRAGQDEACLAAAERVLAGTPDDARALAWKGVALTNRAVAGAAADRAATLADARKAIARAIQADSQSPLALIAWFQSFTKAGEKVPEPAILGMARVIRQVPAAPAPRLYLGAELVRQGNPELARNILYPVLYGADDSPEKKAAQALFPATGR
ncbi:hypothetical protein [Sphingomonas sp. KR3-1]|uniref:hypothetical protein n=1 Tax=Sphingomonas sp. KR3-1 TaxID=3156611 RepID=UPI0032B3FD51